MGDAESQPPSLQTPRGLWKIFAEECFHEHGEGDLFADFSVDSGVYATSPVISFCHDVL